jgi:hypothetical protein
MTIDATDLATEADAATTEGAAPAPAAPVRTKRWWLTFAVGFLVVALGVDIGLRVVASQLSQPRTYFSANAQTLVGDMDVLQARGVRSDLTFVGTSQMRRGIDANQVEDELGLKAAHNVALPGAQTPVVERWLLEEVVPRIHPKRVIWGIQSIDFNAGRDRKSIALYNRARATKQGLYGVLDRAMEKIATSKHRNELRDPLALSKSVGHPTRYDQAKPLDDRAVWKLGYAETTPAQLRRLRAAHEKDIREHQLLDFRVGDEEMRAFEHTLSELQRQGIEVDVVIMPVPTKYFTFHPRGRRDWEQWRSQVTASAKKLGVPIVDMSSAVHDDGFRDYEHLLLKPARKFATELDAKLEALDR